MRAHGGDVGCEPQAMGHVASGDLYQMHRYDPAVDLDETLGALTDLVRTGKVRYIGHST